MDKQVGVNMPKHIGIIMDGNGRWATKRGLHRKIGHARGAQVFRNIVEYCIKLRVNTVTFYAFSSENWVRPRDEVDALMKLIEKYLDEFLSKLTRYDVSVRFIGDIDTVEFDGMLRKKMRDIENKTKGKTMNLNIAMNYGGRNEIVHAVNCAIEKEMTRVKDRSRQLKITAEMIEAELYTCSLPDPDLIIRTANEKRLSNFLLWQSAYAEFWFTDVLWPDFSEKILDEAILEYSGRKRRYGGL